MATSLTCPVCGFEPLDTSPYRDYSGTVPENAVPPYDEFLGEASYEVCPRCEFEFGNDDNPGTAAPSTFEEYRQEWMASGSRWGDKPLGVASVEARLGVALPASIMRLYRQSDGVFQEEGQWWVVWPLERLVSENQQMWQQGTLPTDLLAFGDDGTGVPFCVSTAEDRDEVLRWGLIELDVETSEGDVDAFSREWLGLLQDPVTGGVRPPEWR